MLLHFGNLWIICTSNNLLKLEEMWNTFTGFLLEIIIYNFMIWWTYVKQQRKDGESIHSRAPMMSRIKSSEKILSKIDGLFNNTAQ
jgi:hypothetical protein